jgi:hypothetical protein
LQCAEEALSRGRESLPHYDVRNVNLYGANQSDNPSNKRPSQKEVQQEDCKRVPLAVGECNDGRQKIEEESQAKKWRKEKRKEERENVHICLLGRSRPMAASLVKYTHKASL